MAKYKISGVWKNSSRELTQDVAIFLYKIVNYFYYVSLLLGIFTLVIIIFYLFGNPVANYTSEKGMMTIMIVVGITAIVRFVFKKIMTTKNLI
jgi:hypothetical protein